MLQLTTASL